MADYYPLLARALDALPNSSPAMRKAVYDRARTALTVQLRSLDPPVSEPDIAVEQRALDAAIERLEAALAERADDPAGRPDPVPAAAPVPLPSDRDPPIARPEPPATEIQPIPEATALPTAAPFDPRIDAPGTDGSQTADPKTGDSETAGSDTAGIKSGASGSDGAESGDSSSAPPEEPRTGFVAFVPPPRRKAGPGGPADAPPPPRPERDPAGEPAPVAAAPASGPAQEASEVEIAAPPAVNGDARRPKIGIVAPPAGRSRKLRNAFVGGVLALVIAAIAVAAFLLRDEPARLTHEDDSDGSSAVEPGEQKFADRVGGERGEGDKRPPRVATVPEVTVAQRAIFYEEVTSDPQAQPKTNTGRSVWRLEPVNGEQGQPLQTAVRALAEFPDAGLTLTITIRKNVDATLPASHTVELNFVTSGRLADQVVEEIGLIQLKDDQNARGASVSGLPVRVRDNLFLIGLSNLASDVARNRDLITRRAWMDVALRFRSGQRAVIALEKGVSGTQVLQTAFGQWQD